MYAPWNQGNSMLAVATMLGAALGAGWSAEDLVTAWQRGVPLETTARMVEGVALDEAGGVYLLRRGVPPEIVAAWGFPVTPSGRAEAVALGSIPGPPTVAAPPPTVRSEALDAVIARQVGPTDERGPETGPSYRTRLLRQGRSGVAAGVVLTVAGGFLMVYHSRGREPYMGEFLEPEPSFPWLHLGSLGVMAGGLSFHFGARSLRLAGTDVDPWPQMNTQP